MLFAELDGTGWAYVITAGCIGLSGILTSLLTLILTYKANKDKAERDKVTAAAVKEVASTLEMTTTDTTNKLNEGLKIGRATHTLVNLKTSKQLTTIRNDKQRIFDLIKHSGDIATTAAAKTELETAESDLQDHLTQQAKVDAEFGAEAATKMGTEHPEPVPGAPPTMKIPAEAGTTVNVQTMNVNVPGDKPAIVEEKVDKLADAVEAVPVKTAEEIRKQSPPEKPT
jgi:hypothetical protein